MDIGITNDPDRLVVQGIRYIGARASCYTQDIVARLCI